MWQVTGSYHRTTRAATTAGQFVAFGFIGWGMLTVLGGNWLNGLWLIFIGWFLQNAASSHAQANLREMLRDLFEARVLSGGKRCFLVGEDGNLPGMLNLQDIAQVPRPEWKQGTAGHAMRRWQDLVRMDPQDGAARGDASDGRGQHGAGTGRRPGGPAGRALSRRCASLLAHARRAGHLTTKDGIAP